MCVWGGISVLESACVHECKCVKLSGKVLVFLFLQTSGFDLGTGPQGQLFPPQTQSVSNEEKWRVAE